MRSGKWVSTVEEGFGYDQAVEKGFWVRLLVVTFLNTECRSESVRPVQKLCFL